MEASGLCHGRCSTQLHIPATTLSSIHKLAVLLCGFLAGTTLSTFIVYLRLSLIAAAVVAVAVAEAVIAETVVVVVVAVAKLIRCCCRLGDSDCNYVHDYDYEYNDYDGMGG